MNDQTVRSVASHPSVKMFGLALQLRYLLADEGFTAPFATIETLLPMWQETLSSILSRQSLFLSDNLDRIPGDVIKTTWEAGNSFSTIRLMSAVMDLHVELCKWHDEEYLNESEFSSMVDVLQNIYDEENGPYPIPYNLRGEE